MVLPHESAHFLGLYHTSESTSAHEDQLPDTPSGQAGIGNLMFPVNVNSAVSFSPQQAQVLLRHPLVEIIE